MGSPVVLNITMAKAHNCLQMPPSWGMVYTGNDWQGVHFKTDIPSPNWIHELDGTHQHWQDSYTPMKNINVLELWPIYLGMLRFGGVWAGLHVICRTDNTQVMHCINKGVSMNEDAMALLHEIFWLCVTLNIHLTARHIKGSNNTVADWLSRINSTTWSIFLNHYELCCSRFAMLGP